MKATSAAVTLLACAATSLAAQATGADRPFLSHLSATRADPVYTTYAAAYERSGFVLDEGYHLRFDDPAQPVEFTSSRAGDLGFGFRVGSRWVYLVSDMAAEPVITTSYGDVVRYHYRPFPDLRADVTFLVYSSRLAVQEVTLTNTGAAPVDVDLAAVLRGRGPVFRSVAPEHGLVRFAHRETPDGWTTEHAQPWVEDVQDLLLFSSPADCARALGVAPLADTVARRDTSRMAPPGSAACRGAARADSAARALGQADLSAARLILAQKRFALAPGQTASWRIVRGVAPADSSPAPLEAAARRLLNEPLEPFIRADEHLYRRIPPPPTADPRKQLLYWGAFTLLRQVMLPPEGATRFPYYVFSREPQWGWGHGGQVFHESLSMLAYALMDPAGAMASQRVYAERQHPDGYIPYRIGPYLSETIAYEGNLTTSAPWYAWESWEVYRSTRDPAFLRDIYPSAVRFYDWLAAHRDADGDGLYEWGAHAVLESVRDGDVAVWDQVGWPLQFEALDLNAMMVAEAAALDSMALALGRRAEAARWGERAATLRRRIERTFWDESTGFYYHVDLRRRGFTHEKPNDLKRREIIGFLPLWAGTASPERARRLIATLTDPQRFWRPGGVPSLAADDPYYNPHGYWNGPVWVEWNYLVERGLLRYGRPDLARELVDRVANGMIDQLEKSHVFWEMYSPEADWAGHHQVYIWAGLVARMMLDAYEATPGGARATPGPGKDSETRQPLATTVPVHGSRSRSRQRKVAGRPRVTGRQEAASVNANACVNVNGRSDLRGAAIAAVPGRQRAEPSGCP